MIINSYDKTRKARVLYDQLNTLFISKILSMKYDTILRSILNKTVNHYTIKETEDTYYILIAKLLSCLTIKGCKIYKCNQQSAQS